MFVYLKGRERKSRKWRERRDSDISHLLVHTLYVCHDQDRSNLKTRGRNYIQVSLMHDRDSRKEILGYYVPKAYQQETAIGSEAET